MVYATTERCSLVEITYTVVGAKNPATGVIQRMGIGMQHEFLGEWYTQSESPSFSVDRWRHHYCLAYAGMATGRCRLSTDTKAGVKVTS